MYSENWFCHDCRHLDGPNLACTAFPGGLPFDIVSGQTQHDHPLDGDLGVKYEKAAKPVAVVGKSSPEISYDETIRMVLELELGRSPTLNTPEANALRERLRKECAEIRAKGGQVDLPFD